MLMDCRLSTTLLPGIWAIETLVLSNQIDVSLLLDLLEKFPQTFNDLGRNAREMVSFRILESFLAQGAQSNSLTSSSKKIALDESESCEDVLQRILLETPASNLKADAPEMWKWDVQSFIAFKRSTLDKNALQQLKDAILKGGHSFLASLKEQSGLPYGNPSESVIVNDDKPGDIIHRFERTDSNPHISEDYCQLICPAAENSSYLTHSDKPNDNLLPVKRKGCSTSKISRTESGKDENDIIHCEQDLGGNLSSSVVTRHPLDTSVMIGQYSKTERCVLERTTNFQGTETDGPQEDDNNEITSLKDISGANEVLHCKNQDPHCDTEMPNDKSGDQRAQQIEIREAKGDKEGLCGLRYSEDVDGFEPHVKDHVKNGEGEGKIQVLHCDAEVPIDKYDHEHGNSEIREAQNDEESFCDLKSTKERDKFDLHGRDNVHSGREEGMHIGCDGQSTNSQFSLATNCSDPNILAEADVCTGVDEVSQVLGYSSGNKTCLGSMGQKGPPGDVEFTSSKGLLGHDKEIHRKEQVCNHNAKQDHEDGNAGDSACLFELTTLSRCKDVFEQEIYKNVTDLGDAEGVFSGDSDGCLDERTDIVTKKIAFLSSQCSFSQGSVDCKELNVCVKCNKGGELKVCSINSCQLVVHVSCLGSQMSFNTKGKFYCPFCAYSQALSEYMDIKKKVSLTRTDFATFICLGARKELKKQPCRSEHNDGMYRSIDPNNQDTSKNINNQKRRRKLEYQEAGCSTLSSGDNSPSGGETVDATNGESQPLNEHKREMKKMRPMPQGMVAHGQSQMAASAILRPKGEDASHKDPRKNSMRDQKHKSPYPDIPQLRPKRGSWSAAEEEKLKEGMQLFCVPHERIPWKKILAHGAAVFLDGRTTMDLKDKWRNLCRV